MASNTDIHEMKARIVVFGVGGAGGNAVNNMITAGLQGVEFVVANTDAQALAMSKATRLIQLGTTVTAGLGAGSQPELGRAAAEEVIDTIREHLTGAHMVFVTAGMGGGTGTGAAPIIARTARELGILTIGVVTKPFYFEGQRRMRFAEAGVEELLKTVDTLLIIPNQNLFRVASEKTTFADAFALADQVLYSGVACISDLIVKEGLINLDFADVLSVMKEKGKAMMGRGEASGEKRVLAAAVAAISNPLIENPSIKRASGLIISITGGRDLMLYEVDEAATRIRDEADPDANIIVGASFDESLEGIVRVSVVATGIDNLDPAQQALPVETALTQLAGRLRNDGRRIADRIERSAPLPQAASPPLRARSRTTPWGHRQGRVWTMRRRRRFSRSILTAAPLRAICPTRPLSISRPSCAAPPTERWRAGELPARQPASPTTARHPGARRSRELGCAIAHLRIHLAAVRVEGWIPGSRQEARPGMTA
ncbi:cell division protein FtsZ [Bradyrhizobium diazoefficiens]|uniref:cell division protein FtsZ n=1 Tax=Bradyrhizobium diazoefficiens TaxID=1355477 RepID=UPI0038380459